MRIFVRNNAIQNYNFIKYNYLSSGDSNINFRVELVAVKPTPDSSARKMVLTGFYIYTIF